MELLKKTAAIVVCILFLLTTLISCAPAEEKATDAAAGMTSSLEAVQQDVGAFETVLTLSGLTWGENISAEQIQLSGAFSGMAVKNLERMDDAQLKLSAEGAVGREAGSGVISVSADAIVDPMTPSEPAAELTAEELAAKEQLETQKKDAFLYSAYIEVLRPQAEADIENTGGKEAVVTLTLTDDTFTEQLTPELFTVDGAEDAPEISAAEKTGENICALTFAGNADEAFHALEDAVLKISAEALASGSELETALASHEAEMSAAVDFVEEAEGGFLATILLDLSNGTLADFDESDMTAGGEIAELKSFVKEDDNHAVVQALVKQEGAEIDTLSFDGTLAISGLWGKTRWGSDRENILLDVHYDAGESDRELLAVETSIAYDLLKTGIKSLASSIGSKAGARLMEAVDSDLFGDQTAKQLADLNTYLQQMDSKWSGALSRLNDHVAIVEDKIGQSNCSRILDDYDTLADKLKATVLHLENKKTAVDKAKKGTPEYDAAAAAYVAAVNKENCKVYSDAYVLGKKILKGSAGLSTGVVGSYDEMLSLIYNFDVQTFDLKEEFRVLTLSLYMDAYDQAVLYYQLTEPDNKLLTELQEQMTDISKVVDKMDVKRRTDDNAYCYAAGKAVKRFAGWVSGDGDSGSNNAIDGVAAAKMIERAGFRGTTLGADLDASGFYSVNNKTSFTGDKGSDILIVDIVKSKKYTSKRREWWTTMTKVNVKTHAVDKDVKTYYQRQDKVTWKIFTDDWKQKECWGSYTSEGLVLMNA